MCSQQTKMFGQPSFAALNTNTNQSLQRKKSCEVPAFFDEDVRETRSVNLTRQNEIQVSATGEVSVQPDRCRVNLTVGSRKDVAQEAMNSVVRRLDYILQVLNNNQVKVSE